MSRLDDDAGLGFQPSKIIGIARNYRAHAQELNNSVPEDEPLFFYKPLSSLAYGAERISIHLPPNVGRVDYEGELGVVIGKRAQNVSQEEALEYVSSYVPAFDVTARALQKSKGHFSLAKGFDSFCPVGSIVDGKTDASDIRIRTFLNGNCVQDGRTSQMVHSIPSLISYLSSVVTLEQGDLILTGTPAGVGSIAAGDELRLEIDGFQPMNCLVCEREF